MRATCILLALALATSGMASGTQYRVERGDTLWDLSGRFWDRVDAWPELWALNPQIRNPHFIYPGDLLSLERLQRQAYPPTPGEVVRLPLVSLKPSVQNAAAQDSGAEVAATPEAGGRADAHPGAPEVVRLSREQTEDFISSHRLTRRGTVENRHQVKVAYAAGEDVEVTLAPDIRAAPGDLMTLFDDSCAVVHPISCRPEGFYVRILGHLRVRVVQGDRVVGRLVETYHAVEDGAGAMAYRPPVERVSPKPVTAPVEGVILAGTLGRSMYAEEDTVFLDRGAVHGLSVGALVEIPVREGSRPAQGMVDLTTPLARIVVVSVEDKTAAGVVLASRASLEAGDRFVAAAP